MIDHESKAIQYVVDQFLRYGVIVERAGIESVLRYYDEYWEQQYDIDNVEVIFHEPGEREAYIKRTRPDIPSAVIDAVLEADKAYIQSKVQ